MERIPITREGLKALTNTYEQEMKHQLLEFYVSSISTSVIQYAKSGVTEYLYRVKYREIIPYIKEILASLRANFPDSEITPIYVTLNENITKVDEEFQYTNAILINWS